MATNIPVKDVISPRHLAAFVLTDRTTNNRAKMEVYTGWVVVDHKSGGGAINRVEFVSFVPISNLTVQQYQPNDLLDITVTAAPSSVTGSPGESNTAAVDSAKVALEPQSLPGVAGNPNCLVLRAVVAGFESIVHVITYQVTVLTRIAPDRDIEPIRIDPNIAPR